MEKKKKNKKLVVLLIHVFLFATVFFFHATGYNKVLSGYMSNETNVLKLGQKDPKISRNNFEDVQTVIDDATIAEQVEAKQTINHTWELTETVDAKCFEDGHNTYVCSDCGATYTETIPMTGHDWADDKVEPTCTERGYTRHTCWKCWETHTDNYVPALGHDYVVTEEDLTEHDDATNVTKHYKVYTCTRCGDSYRDFVRAEFGYKGAVQEFVVEKDGVYKVEAWGAASGSGQKGGYISGEVELHEGDILYVAVGGQGGYGNTSNGKSGNHWKGGAGGWNGGGSGGNGGKRSGKEKPGGAGGGGATSIAKADADATDEEKAALNKTLPQIGQEEFDENGLIVAGGAGGSNYNIGANGDQVGGSNNTNNTFGQGTNGRSGGNYSGGGFGNGGGGGGYRGGKAGTASGKNTWTNGRGGSSWANEDQVEEVAAQAGVQSGNGAAVVEFVSDLPVEEPEEEIPNEEPENEEDTTPEDEEPTPTEEVTE